MLPVYFNISKQGIRKINNNIDNMLDLAFDMSDNLKDIESIDFLFPKFLIALDPDYCKKKLIEFRTMVNDEYERDYLKPIYEYILFQLLHFSLDDEDDEFAKDIPYELFQEDEEIPEEYYINYKKSYLEFMFEDYDFLSLPDVINCDGGSGWLTYMLGIDMDKYVDLMPYDIREKYLEKKQILVKQEQKTTLLLKAINNAIKELEDTPTSAMKLSEPEINNLIASIAKQPLLEKGICINREKPQGYALKSMGEVDFYIYTVDNYEIVNVAIGEGKEWGKFALALDQLFGYMTRSSLCGFTITINRNNEINQIKKDIVKFLEVYESNGAFRAKKTQCEDNYIISSHEVPEFDNKLVEIYHFILDLNSSARDLVAKRARSPKMKSKLL